MVKPLFCSDSSWHCLLEISYLKRPSKTKVKSALIPGEQRQGVLLDGEPLEDVEVFNYIANSQGTEEIRSRINLARFAFFRLQSCLWSWREISLRIKGRVYQALVRLIL